MSDGKSILVVDGDKRARMAAVRALESSGCHVESATSGEEALLMLRASPFDLMLLSLKLQRMDGLELLRRVRDAWPATRVVAIAAHATIEEAVEAMKQGAADFAQKPLAPQRICALVAGALEPVSDAPGLTGYDGALAEARRLLEADQISVALSQIHKAVGEDPTRPEAFNLLGAAAHLSGQRYKAQDYFRAALALDATYRPARQNLERSVTSGLMGPPMELMLADDRQGERKA